MTVRGTSPTEAHGRRILDSQQANRGLETLTGQARGRFGRIKPQRIAEHILQQMPDADWPVLRGALDALARRYSFARRDGLALAAGSRRGPAQNTFRTRGTMHRRGTRPYDTELLGVAPLRISCSCADYVRSSLGLCKHGLVALEALEVRGALERETSAAPRARARLLWDSHQPLLGSTDRLERLRIVSGGKGTPFPSWKDGRPPQRELRKIEQRLQMVAALEQQIRRGALESEPAVLTLLAEERARAERLRAASAAVAASMKNLKSLQRKLYPYQRDGVRRFLEVRRLLLADDMGLGKTTQAVAACHALLESRQIQRGLLIVPASLKRQWKREWDATTHLPLQLVEGSPAERKKQYTSFRRGVLVIGYEQLLRDFEHVERFAPELVVLDEAQRIKNWATKSAAYVKALGPAFRLVLTGTPLENRYDELASIMDFVDDLALEPKWRLTPLHSVSDGGAGRGTVGARHLSVLRERLAPVMIRRVRREVLAQLPPRIDTRVPVEFTVQQRDAHDDLRRPIAQLLTAAGQRPLKQAEFLRLMQLLTRQRMICNGLAQVQFEYEWPRLQTLAAMPQVLESLFAPKLATLRGNSASAARTRWSPDSCRSADQLPVVAVAIEICCLATTSPISGGRHRADAPSAGPAS